MPVPLADRAADEAVGHTPVLLRLFQAAMLFILAMAAIVSIAMIGTAHDRGRPAIHSTPSPRGDLFSGMRFT